MLKKINTQDVSSKKFPKKTQKFPNVSEILYYTLTKELNLTPEQIYRKMKQFSQFVWQVIEPISQFEYNNTYMVYE